ncbi:MAG: hypothetical protein K6T94_14925 [Paenibacillus sp.]|nr:hypothetical protein [Paenibacillus sp.]
MIGNAMVISLCDIYENYIRYRKPKQKRKEIKIISDSVIEQLYVFYINDKKFDGKMNVRQKVVEKIKNATTNHVSNEDLLVLNSFNNLLRRYDEVFGKGYNDYEDLLDEFINSILRELIKNITSHSSLVADRDAIRLRSFL